jgi:hypothetical protein
VVKLAQVAFFTISTHSWDCWICTSILSAQVVALINPHLAKSLDDGTSFVLVHKSNPLAGHILTEEGDKIKAQSPQLKLQHNHSDFALSYVSAIKWVQTVCSENALLNWLNTSASNVLNKIAMLNDILINLLNHDFQRLVFIASTIMVEIEVKEL